MYTETLSGLSRLIVRSLLAKISFLYKCLYRKNVQDVAELALAVVILAFFVLYLNNNVTHMLDFFEIQLNYQPVGDRMWIMKTNVQMHFT